MVKMQGSITTPPEKKKKKKKGNMKKGQHEKRTKSEPRPAIFQHLNQLER